MCRRRLDPTELEAKRPLLAASNGTDLVPCNDSLGLSLLDGFDVSHANQSTACGGAFTFPDDTDRLIQTSKMALCFLQFSALASF